MPRPEELVGAWRLESFHDTDAAGGPITGPLGADPDGFLLYTACGHLAVGMMRTAPGAGPADYMGYGGRWRLDNGVLHHLILVCSRPDWVGVDQIRVAELDGDLLTIRTSPDNGRIVQWRRAVSTQGALLIDKESHAL
ncbi:lipocalin-like domain-containing protein [Nocardia sp. NBC_01327]|uniref:lipocalin-like domain-containing protein n=1 Tax=Nocardia sp. NBC_01327 TaxID=2903593 RepID=UPI002E160AC3|nr:lipocalin-like domain-containing protein [Nocardia sp. NBC_01327]